MKSYAERFYSEQNFSGGPTSAFGPNATGDHGNAIISTDWYASNDARKPFPIGSMKLQKPKNELNKRKKNKPYVFSRR